MSSTRDALLGSTEPRLWTPPLRDLDEPGATFGYDVCDFAEVILDRPLDPWQQWLVIHGGELLDDGRPRFRVVLVVVARQNGKTEALVVLSLYWLFRQRVRLVLGTSTNLGYAKESWEKAVDLADSVPELAELVGRVRRAAGEESLVTRVGSRYKIAASNRKGGRSLTIDRLILDELREHDDWSAWNAAIPAMNAVPDAQAWAITNQGDDKSVVLESLRSSALGYLESGEGDQRLGLFEWSAPDRSQPDDLDALAQANPNLGRRIDVDSLVGDALRAKAAGGEELAGFKTEIMCMRVPMLDPAIDAEAWAGCLDVGTLDGVRARVALCLDVSLDGRHATLVAAAMLADGRVRVEVVAAWSDTASLRRELPELVATVRPRKLGWFPAGPAAAVAADLAERVGWPPRGVEVEAIRQDVAAVCMGLAEQVSAGDVAHSDDPLLNAHIEGAERAQRGDAWVFTRRGAGHCDATYAAAGAVHLARTMPASVGKPRIITAADSAD